MEFANFPKDNPILLYDFFKAFFKVYESMKSNSDILNKNITFTNKKLSNINLKINSLKTQERIYDSASSTNLKIRIELIVIDPPSNNLKDSLKFVFTHNNQTKEIPYELADSSIMTIEKNQNNSNMAHSFINFGKGKQTENNAFNSENNFTKKYSLPEKMNEIDNTQDINNKNQKKQKKNVIKL